MREKERVIYNHTTSIQSLFQIAQPILRPKKQKFHPNIIITI